MPELREIAPDPSEFLKTTVTIQGQIGWDHHFHYIFNLQKRWGKQIITETWKFVLNSWQIRNDTEHDNKGDQLK
jgi:hypothetical protein